MLAAAVLRSATQGLIFLLMRGVWMIWLLLRLLVGAVVFCVLEAFLGPVIIAAACDQDLIGSETVWCQVPLDEHAQALGENVDDWLDAWLFNFFEKRNREETEPSSE